MIFLLSIIVVYYNPFYFIGNLTVDFVNIKFSQYNFDTIFYHRIQSQSSIRYNRMMFTRLMNLLYFNRIFLRVLTIRRITNLFINWIYIIFKLMLPFHYIYIILFLLCYIILQYFVTNSVVQFIYFLIPKRLIWILCERLITYVLYPISYLNSLWINFIAIKIIT